ncbi:Ff.00g043960.m01.CDS01 [Fusarium sp. VM40]|nr:Ff.00g043960.m01.CDS01 [Fusarium sp. VM40]
MTVKLSSDFIEALALLPREVTLAVNDDVLKSASLGPRNTIKIVAAMWTVGWFVFGLISIICLNGRSKAGRWVPDWYRDHHSKGWARLGVLAWWICVFLFWPIIWVYVLFGVTGRAIKKRFTKWRESKKEKQMADVIV